jgi:hypothetical protein
MKATSTRSENVLDTLRPTPFVFAGLVTGGTIGAYTAGPVGAIAGMVLGTVLYAFVERAIDRRGANSHKPTP